MGAIVQWILTNGQRIAGWALVLTAIGALAMGIQSSGAWSRFSTATENFGTLITKSGEIVTDVTGSLNDALDKALDESNSWVRLMLYMVYFEGWGHLTAFVSANVQGLLVLSFGSAVVLFGLVVLVFTYTKARQLGQAIGQLAVR